jgi:hypothetical protein
MPGGSLTMNKHRPLQASSSVGLKHLARWDVTIGTHALEYGIHPITVRHR